MNKSQIEYLDIVDENDNVLGIAEYGKVHQQHLRHRVIHIMIFNSRGEFLLQRRSKYKSAYPLHWTMSVGGHVRSGETYKQAAIREAKEELGIRPKVKPVYKNSYTDIQGHQDIFTTFMASYDGDFMLDKKEVEEVRFFNTHELQKLIKDSNNIQPELLFLLREYFKLL